MRSKSPVRKVRSELANQPSRSKQRKALQGAIQAIEKMEQRMMMSSVITWNFGTGTANPAPSSGTPVNFTAGNFSVAQPYGTDATPITTASTSAGYTTANGIAASGSDNIGLPYNTGNATLSLTANPYYTVTLTPASGYKLEVDGYSYGSRSTSTGPTTETLYSSIDGFTTPLETNAIGNTSAWTAEGTASLSTAPQGTAGTAVELRLYLSGNSGTAAGNSGVINNKVDDVSITATAIAIAAPMVTSVAPYGGTLNGGNTVIIKGSGFTGATASTVLFGATPATSVVVNSDGQITAVAPAHAAGQVDVLVSTPLGGSSTPNSTDKYTYTTAPVVASVSPVSGTTLGGATVTITGSNFTGATAVKFGSVAATSFAVNSDFSITAVDPAESTGSVDVTVTASGVTSQTNAATVGGPDTFTYVAPTTIANAESLTTGTVVTLNDNPVVTYVINQTPGSTVGNKTYSTAAYIINDGTGSLEVSASSAIAYTPTLGDELTVTGTYTLFDGIPEIESVTAITRVGATTPPASPTSPDPVPNPTIAQTSVVNAGPPATLSQNIEGYVVTLKAVDVYLPPYSDGSQFEVTNDTGTITDTSGNTEELYYYPTSFESAAALLNSEPFPTGLVDVTGIASIYTSGSVSTPQFIPLSISTDTTALPVVSSISPLTPSGPVAGGNTIQVNGYGFQGSAFSSNTTAYPTVNPVSSVTFQNSAGVVSTTTNFSFVTVNGNPSDNELDVVVPQSSTNGAQIVDVEVTNGNGTSLTNSGDKYTYTAAPVINTVVPNGGPFNKNTTTTITGLSFGGATSIKFGSTAGTILSDSATQIVAVAPTDPGITANTSVDITIQTSSGGTSTAQSNDVFIYAVAPTITSIAPTSGAVTGGSSVVITGTNFMANTTANPNDTTVTIGGVNAPVTNVNLSAGTITVTVPAGTNSQIGPSGVPVIVTTLYGPVTSGTNFVYTQSNIAAAEAATSGSTVTINSNPVITAIVSTPGTYDGASYTKYALIIQDATGSLEVFGTLPSGTYTTPAVGDEISVSGTYAPFDAIPEVESITAISLIAQGQTAAGPTTPLVKTIPQVNSTTLNVSAGGVGDYLVTLDDVTITGLTGTFGTSNLTGTITDGTNSIVLYFYVSSYSSDITGLPGQTPLYGTTIPTGPVDITGFVDVYSGPPAEAEFNPIAITPYVASTTPSWLALTGGATATYSHTNETLTVDTSSGGTATIVGDPTTTSDGTIAITVNPNSTLGTNLTSGTTVHIGSLTIGTNANYSNSSTFSTGSSPKPIVFDSGALTIASSGMFQLANGYLDLVSGTLSTVNAYVALGYNNGAFNGLGGIDDSLAASDTSHLTAAGVAPDPSTITTIDGATVTPSTDIIVRTTYFGDADLSLKVDGTDYSRIDSAFVNHTTNGGWYNGDFNYDGVVNGSDYTLIDNAFNTQGHGSVTPTAIIAKPEAAYAVAPLATPDSSIFSDKKVKESLADEIDALITN